MKQARSIRHRARDRVINQNALKEVRELLGEEPKTRDTLIEHLHKIQDEFHHISSRHMEALAYEMKLSMAEVYETATFYHHFDVIKENETPPPETTIRVCDSVTCEMFGSKQLIAELQAESIETVRIQAVPCVGRCAGAPVAVVGMNPIETAEKQNVINLAKAGAVAPTLPDTAIGYDQYCQKGGYELWKNCVAGKHDQEAIISMLEDSKLRGLGGAGFPTGRKWRILSEQASPKMVAINIDEGEPGTFKDRYYLERDPHRFIEGTLIAHWAIQAEKIYLYLRDEYAGCRELLQRELQHLKANPPGELPEIHLRRGAGAYICGEESAMIESIEGKKGMPRLRPPYVAQVGLFGHPTLEQNMETMHWVREIIEKGADWFASHGRHERTGLRSFSVSGRINKPGVHLAPAGITMLELIDEYCGGMLDGHQFYGYFPGGASGGILPAELGNLPLDFDTLQAYGCFIGSAAIIVLSDQDSAKQMALNAMRFFEDESCGQCTPCRVGTAKAVKLMHKQDWDQLLLEELAQAMEDASICGLGQAAPNPLRCAIKYFPQEFK